MSLDYYSLKITKKTKFPQSVILFDRNFWDVNNKLGNLLHAQQKKLLCKDFLRACNSKTSLMGYFYKDGGIYIQTTGPYGNLKIVFLSGGKWTDVYVKSIKDAKKTLSQYKIGWRGPIIAVSTFKKNYKKILNIILNEYNELE